MSVSRFKRGKAEATILDRISELPDVIIQHIFSFLEPKTAARASVLSKSLFRAWSTRPVLDFESYFTSNFADVVTNTLRNFRQKRIPLQKFRLHIEELCDHRIDFRDWLQMTIRMVLQIDIKELDLCLHNYSFVLTDGDVKCGNLKILNLKQVDIDECTFHYLISRCPLIEQLHLTECPKLKKICDATIPNLRTLYMQCMTMKEINVNLPRLESFSCDRDHLGVIDFGECTGLKSLSLSNSYITDERLQSLLSKNPFLENLRLDNCPMLKKIAISSPCLKNLRINEFCSSLEKGIDAPNLHLLEYSNWFCQAQFPLYFRNPAGPGKRNSNIALHCQGEIYADWFRGLRELLTKFQKTAIRVAVSHADVRFSDERLQVIPLPSEHEVVLFLNYDHKINLPLFGRLLTMCHPKSVICTYKSKLPENQSRMKNLCQNLRTGKAQEECCGSSQIKCWKHYLMDSKLFYEVNNERKPLDWNSLITPSRVPNELRKEYRWRIAFDFDWKPL